MTDEVGAAILHRFEACLPSISRRPDIEGYTRAPSDNLLPQVDPDVLTDFSSGDGGELEGDLPTEPGT